MIPEAIEHLLREADEAGRAGSSADSATLAANVLRIHKSRQRRRRMSAAALGLLVFGASTAMLTRSPSVRPMHREMAVPGQPDLAKLTAQINTAEAEIQRLFAAEREADQRVRLVKLAATPTPSDAAERAASAAVTQADRLAKTAGLAGAAIRAYSEVIDHLPETHSADLARQRIAELRKEG